MCALICRGRRPRRPGRGLRYCPVEGSSPLPTNRWKMTSNIQTGNHAHLRADMESAPTVARCGLPYGRRGRFYIGPSGASALGGQSDGRHPAKPARSCGSMPHRGIDRCAPPQRRPLRTGFRQAMEGKRDAASSLRADDEHWPLQMRNTSGRGEHCSPVNWAIAKTPAGAHCAPLHPL